MSAANLSRIENGEQGPPSDETIAQLARVLHAEPAELLVLAGRTVIHADSDTLLREVRQLRREVRDGFARIEAAMR